jgi:ribosome biogenesis GTPase A
LGWFAIDLLSRPEGTEKDMMSSSGHDQSETESSTEVFSGHSEWDTFDDETLVTDPLVGTGKVGSLNSGGTRANPKSPSKGASTLPTAMKRPAIPIVAIIGRPNVGKSMTANRIRFSIVFKSCHPADN